LTDASFLPALAACYLLMMMSCTAWEWIFIFGHKTMGVYNIACSRYISWFL